MLKKLLSISLITILGLISCGKSNQNTENQIRVGMECGYAPFNWFQNNDANGAVKTDGGYCGGYDVEIAKIIADGLGKELVIVKSDWDPLLGPAINSGKIDLVIAGMSATPERQNSLAFSKPYYDSDLVVVVRKDSEFANAKTLNDFQGAKITGQLNTLHYDVIDQLVGSQKEVPMENFPTMIVSLESGRIDGYISEKPGAIAASLSNPNLTYVEFEKGKGFEYDTNEVYVSIGMKLGDDELLNKVNEILSGLSSEDKEKLMEKAIAEQPLQQ